MEDEGAAPGERPDLERLDFAGLTERDANEVRNAIARFLPKWKEFIGIWQAFPGEATMILLKH